MSGYTNIIYIYAIFVCMPSGEKYIPIFVGCVVCVVRAINSLQFKVKVSGSDR